VGQAYSRTYLPEPAQRRAEADFDAFLTGRTHGPGSWTSASPQPA